MADSVIRFLFRGDAKGAKDALQQVDQGMRTATAAADGLNIGIREVAVKLARFVAGGFEAADAMAELSRHLGIAAEDIAAYRRAAELSGTTQEAVTTAMERMNRTFGDAASGSAEAAGSLERLGLDIQQMLSLSPPEQFSAVAAALADIESPALRSARAQEILGRSAGQLATLLLTEQETMERARYEAELFGTALSDDAAVKVEAANDAISRLGLATEGLSVQMAVTFAPAVKWLGDAVQSTVEWMGGMAEVAKVASTALVALSTVAAAAIAQKFGLASALRKASVAMVALGGATRVAGLGLGLLGGPFGLVLAAATAVSLFATRTREASMSTLDLNESVDEALEKFRQLSDAGKRSSLDVDRRLLDSMQRELRELNADIAAAEDPAVLAEQRAAYRKQSRHGGTSIRKPIDPDSFSLHDEQEKRLDLMARIDAQTTKITAKERELTHGRTELAAATDAAALVEERFGIKLAELDPLQAKHTELTKDIRKHLDDQNIVGEEAAGVMARVATALREQTAEQRAAEAALQRSIDAGEKRLLQLEPTRAATQALAEAEQQLALALAADRADAARSHVALAKLYAEQVHGIKVTAANEAQVNKLAEKMRLAGDSYAETGEAIAVLVTELTAAEEAQQALLEVGQRSLDLAEPGRVAYERYAEEVRGLTALFEKLIEQKGWSAELQERFDNALDQSTARFHAATKAIEGQTAAHNNAAAAATRHANANGQLIALLERLTGLDLGALRGGGVLGEPGGLGGGSIGGGAGIDLGALFSLGNLTTIGGSLALGTDLGRAGGLGYLGHVGSKALQVNFGTSFSEYLSDASGVFNQLFDYTELLKGAIGSLAGGFAGNKLGEGLFGKVAENNYLATAGSVVGGIFGGPLGGALGSFVGSLLDVAFGGDGVVRSNVGAFVTPNKGFHGVNNKRDRLGVTRTGASGLEFTPFARRGDKDAAGDFTDALLGIDAALTSAARAVGLTVDFTGRQLSTGRSADDKGRTNSYFGASTGAATTPEEQARLFVEGWIDALGDELPERVGKALDRIQGDAEELAAAFGAALQIDKLLKLDVIEDVDAAVAELMSGQRSLAEQYRSLSDEALEIAGRGIAGADSLKQLNEALLAQKQAALQLSLAYHALSDDVDALLGRTAANIRAALRTPEQQYEHLRGVAANALKALEVDPAALAERFRAANPEASAEEIARLVEAAIKAATDPEQIARLVREANDAVAAAWQLLSPEQRTAMADGLIEFLNEIDEAAQEAINAGFGRLEASEDQVEAAGNDFLVGTQTLADAAAVQSEAGDKQKEAGEKQDDAGDKQYEAAVIFRQAAALLEPHLPLLAQLGINGEGVEVNAP